MGGRPLIARPASGAHGLLLVRPILRLRPTLRLGANPVLRRRPTRTRPGQLPTLRLGLQGLALRPRLAMHPKPTLHPRPTKKDIQDVEPFAGPGCAGEDACNTQCVEFPRIPGTMTPRMPSMAALSPSSSASTFELCSAAHRSKYTWSVCVVFTFGA